MKDKNDNKLYVRLFDGFEMRLGKDGEPFSFGKHMSAKSVQLLQLMMLHYGESRPKAKIIEELYGSEELENPNGTLNNTIFRLRKLLDASPLPQDDYINIKKGMLSWKGNLEVEVDAAQMMDAVKQAEKTDDRQEKIKNYKIACEAYKGEFLPYLNSEEWAVVAAVTFQNLYFDTLRKLLRMYLEDGDYKEILWTATKAAVLYPYEEWQIWRIDSLIALNRYQEALDIYQATVKFHFEEYNQSPSKEIQERFQLISEQMHLTQDSINVICEGMHEDPRVMGGYYCNYSSFVDTYRAFARIAERSGRSVFLLLCTIPSVKSNTEKGAQKMRDRAEQFEVALRKSLRRGDIFTRYNKTQYLVLLMGVNNENCSIVIDRIDGNYRAIASGREKIDYSIISIIEYEKKMMEKRRFGKSLWLGKDITGDAE